MIDQLAKIKQAIAQKPLIPILSFVHIYSKDGERRMQSNNGKLCVDTGVNFGMDVTVHGNKFIRATKLCKSKTKVKLTPTGRLSIISGKFRALIETADCTKFPRLELTARPNCLTAPNLPEICKTLLPFISDDASRPWSRSILFRGGKAYATNNIVIACVPCGGIPDCVVPAYAVEVLAALNMPPVDFIVGDGFVGFFFTDGTWVRTCIIDSKWPSVEKLITPTKTQPLPADFLDSLESIVPFCEDPKMPTVYLNQYGIHTSLQDFGASLEVADFTPSKFRVEPLLQIAQCAKEIDLSTYPKPCYFVGDNGLHGVIIGVQ